MRNSNLTPILFIFPHLNIDNKHDTSQLTRDFDYVGSMLGQGRRRWPNIEPTLDQRLCLMGRISDLEETHVVRQGVQNVSILVGDGAVQVKRGQQGSSGKVTSCHDTSV